MQTNQIIQFLMIFNAMECIEVYENWFSMNMSPSKCMSDYFSFYITFIVHLKSMLIKRILIKQIYRFPANFIRLLFLLDALCFST